MNGFGMCISYETIQGKIMKLLLILMFVVTGHASASDLNDRKKHIERMEQKISVEASERKLRSETILKQLGVPINDHLPYIEDSNEALIRDKEEVALRAITLLIVAAKAEGVEQDIIESLIHKYQVKDVLTNNERAFISDLAPSDFDKTQFIWRYEAAWVLLWSLGYVEKLSEPNSICDVPKAVSILRERTRQEFIDDSQLRSISTLLDENDLIYRYHWAVVSARVSGLDIPKDIDSSVVLERHYALNWLTGYLRQEWDDVSTDT